MPHRLATNYPTREIGRPMDTEAIKRHAFNRQGIVVVKLDDPRLTWDQREMVKQVGTRLYGGKK